MPLDFGLSSPLTSDLFIRYREELPGFVLFRRQSQVALVDRLLLHIDFPAAEHDNSVGPRARGTGVLEFSRTGPPFIVDREITRTNNPARIGFCLDVACPYSIIVDDKTLEGGIAPHVFASTFLGGKEAFSHAYEQYKSASAKGHKGIPVFDVYGWATSRRADAKVHKPRLQLCGFAKSLSEPLSPDEVKRATDLRQERMTTHKLNRPRLDVTEALMAILPIMEPTAA